ncbi:predicted protein [Botrytis cinerea T4]|uniref:Uncharacterized protein n=1 Tax=Botryotinia fuckeliana (strain T4) TaxID=999810 RepID=G2YJ95_BOTF4|nr:predicted protein [Botrytis cinerea T4]
MSSHIPWHSELSCYYGTLSINYACKDSGVKYHISQYATITQEIQFRISLPKTR